MTVEDLAIALPMALPTKNFLQRIIDSHPTNLTRRNFLKKRLSVAATTVLVSGMAGLDYLRYFSPVDVADAPNEQIRQYLQNIAAMMRP